MTKIQRLMRLHRLMAEAVEGADGGGGSAGEGQATTADTSTLLTAAGPEVEPGASAATDAGQGQAEGETEKQEGDDKAQKPEGAPETYADFTLPDGVELKGETAEAFKGLAKELNLTQGQAQKLADLGAKQAQEGVARQAEMLKAANAEWTAQSQADKEFGGQALHQNLAIARKAMDTFATPELRNLLTESGLGNHPEVIRMFYRTGKAISEDGFVGGRGTRGAKSDTEVFYGNSSTTAQ